MSKDELSEDELPDEKELSDEPLRTAVRAAIEALSQAQTQHMRGHRNSYHLTQAALHLRTALLWLHAKDLEVI